MSAPAAERATERRLPRRKTPWLVLGVVFSGLAICAGYYLRGTWATSTPAEVTSPEQGAVSQLVLAPDGQKEIRTAIVIPVSVETAWSILSNYEEWEKLFKTVRRKQATEKLDANRHHVVSDVLTPLGTITLDFIVTHEQTPGGGYRAWWDAPTKELPVNKGTIEIQPIAADRTLLVYTIRKQYREYPQFLVNNMLYSHQSDLVQTLRDRMVEAANEP
jgi:hypothetical protein